MMKLKKQSKKICLQDYMQEDKMLKVLYPVVEVKDGKKRSAKEVDLVEKLFTEIAPKYESRNGGYTRNRKNRFT